MLLQQGNKYDPKTKKKSERTNAGSVSGRKTKPGETGRGRKGENRPELIHAEKGEHSPGLRPHIIYSCLYVQVDNSYLLYQLT